MFQTPLYTAAIGARLTHACLCAMRSGCAAAASSAMLLGAFLFLSCSTAQAQSQCSGQNGSIADYDSKVHYQLDTQLLDIFGTYCTEANGAEQVAFGAVKEDLPCNMLITRDGNFTFQVGERKVLWRQTSLMMTQTGDNGNAHYYLWGGHGRRFRHIRRAG